MDEILKINDLTKTFFLSDGSKTHAVEHVSFSLCNAETLAIVGESGCGKSTLAQVICRLLRPTDGQIVLNGHDITRLRSKEMRVHRRQMQMIFQDPFASLDPRRNVGYAVGEPLKIHKIARGEQRREIVGSLFERVSLTRAQMEQFPHQFSGGQRQRICIARALALNPQIVIADESVSALDVSVQAQVINLMMELQRERHLSYLFITHDLAVVERMAHRIAVMYLGQIVEIGPRSAVFENPTHSYTKRLLDAAPIADPGQRRTRPLLTGEIPSPRWQAGESPEGVKLVEVESGHFVAEE